MPQTGMAPQTGVAPPTGVPPLHAAELVRGDPASVPVEYSGPTTREDQLLSCLVIMTRIFGSPKSPAALATGLPIGDEGMTPDLFLRAADRSGLSASQVRRKLDQVDKISSSRYSTTVELGLGLVARVTPTVALFVSADYSSDVDDNDLNGLIGSLGVRMRW